MALRLKPSPKGKQMLTIKNIITKLELDGTTVRNRCAGLFIRSEFDRLINLLTREIFVSMLIPIHRKQSTEDSAQMGDRDQEGIFFFESLVQSTAADIRLCMSPDVEAFWASQGLLEGGGFMRHLAPAIEVFQGLLDDNADAAGAPEQQ
jgi:hypothetical protein